MSIKQDKYYVKAYTHVYNVYNLDQTNLKEARPELYAKIENKFKQMDQQNIVPMEEGKMFQFEPMDKMIAEDKWICPITTKEDEGAYYSPSKNMIVVPPKKNFIDGESFYGNTLHEMVHSTGSDKLFDRLDNKTGDRKFDYAREELVAEMGAAVVAHQYGFDKHIKDDSAAYLKGWLKSLKSVDYDNDGKADVVISDPLADKKQGEGENRGHPEDVAMVAEEMSAHRKR